MASGGDELSPKLSGPEGDDITISPQDIYFEMGDCWSRVVVYVRYVFSTKKVSGEERSLGTKNLLDHLK